MADKNVVTACFRAKSLDGVTAILKKWRAEYGKNISESRIEFVLESEEGFCIFFSYRNWLTEKDAEEIDLALTEIALEFSTCANGELKLVS